MATTTRKRKERKGRGDGSSQKNVCQSVRLKSTLSLVDGGGGGSSSLTLKLLNEHTHSDTNSLP